MNDFAAIDFETANGQRSSVCSVGVVMVRGGLITDTFYSLIRPTPNYYAWFCQEVHGHRPLQQRDYRVQHGKDWHEIRCHDLLSKKVS